MERPTISIMSVLIAILMFFRILGSGFEMAVDLRDTISRGEQKENVTEVAAEATVEAETEPVTEPVTEAATQPATEPVTEPATQPATEPVTEPATTAPVVVEETTTAAAITVVITPVQTFEDPHLTGATEDLTYVSAEQIALFKARLLQRINELRASEGHSQLTYNIYLESAAIVRSQEIVSCWSHTRPDGTRGMYVLADLGGIYADMVDCISNNKACSYSIGENLAYTYSYSNYTGTDEEIIAIADTTFDNWCNSNTHKQNMLHDPFTDVGFGVTVTMDETGALHVFWVSSLYCKL
ncbi:MAG: hypothetical protein K6F92_02820 [Lachnospiraceae bacterium]|nr:hypothetical protein [Lachnospiraceae bacterium]